MSDLDKPLRDAVWQAHELSIKMRGLLDAERGPHITVAHADLERLIVLTSFIGGYRLAELDRAKEKP
jgi:hypothetical protein